LLVNQDNTPRAQEFIDIISKNKTFAWRRGHLMQRRADLIAHGVQATLVIPQGGMKVWRTATRSRCCFTSTEATSTQPMP
jgi:hypothetical protein